MITIRVPIVPAPERDPCLYSWGPCGKCNACAAAAEVPHEDHRTWTLVSDYMGDEGFASLGYEDEGSVRVMKFETACFDMDDEDEFEEGNEHERVFVDGECGKRDFLLQLVEDRLKERNVDGELLSFAFEPHVLEEEDA